MACHRVPLGSTGRAPGLLKAAHPPQAMRTRDTFWCVGRSTCSDIPNLCASQGQVLPWRGRQAHSALRGKEGKVEEGDPEGPGGKSTTASSGFPIPICFQDKLQSPQRGPPTLSPSPSPSHAASHSRMMHLCLHLRPGSFRDISPAGWCGQDRVPGRAFELSFQGRKHGSALEKRRQHSKDVKSPSPLGTVAATCVCITNRPESRGAVLHLAT